MARAKAPKPNPPAAPSGADSAAAAAGNQPSQVGAGTQPAGSSYLPAGSAPGEIAQDVRVHLRAVQSDVPQDLLHQVCAGHPEISDVLGARSYPDRWVLVVMSARACWKIEVPHAP